MPDVIIALQAAEAAIGDAIDLLPSFIQGLHIESASINVRSLSQQSPLRETFAIALLAVYQQQLNEEIPALIEELFNVKVSDRYDTLLTVVVLAVIFYGLQFAGQVAAKGVANHRLKEKYDSIVTQLAGALDRPEDEVRRIMDAKFAKPSALKKLAKDAQRFFRPSQREGAAPVTIDRSRIEAEIVREVPYENELDGSSPFQKVEVYDGVQLDIHAQDKDKGNTGWAAVPQGIVDRRLRMKLMPPLTAADIWNENSVTADIAIVSELTSDGYTPVEIHLTQIVR